ncbi:ATP-binding protein, partial [Acinetobacter baumannii]
LNLFIYRLLQECLNNIIKHAKATAITVRVSYDQGELTFSIEDNGVGFDVEMATGIKKGLGLENIRKRVALLGGSVEFDSVLNEGTTVKF